MLKTTRTHRNLAQQEGFTLLELSFVIIIIGVMMVPMLEAVNRYMSQRKTDYTEVVIAAASNLIVEYRANGVEEPFHNNSYVYPCPAKRTLARTDNDFGESIDCSNLAAYGLNAPGDCSDGVCLTTNPGQDRDGDGNDDWIIIGGFPVTTMLIAASTPGQDLDFRTSDIFSKSMDLDGWQNQLTYAVSYNLTQDGSLDKFWYGVIAAKDEYGNDTAGMGNDAHFVVLSHGPDRKGAYNNNGLIPITCGTTMTDDENCDNDAVFVQALGSFRGDAADHYDDFARFSKETSLSIWEETQDATGRDQLFFAPTGNLGINIDNTPPSIAMAINGDLKANNNIITNEICDEPKLNPDGSVNSNSNCFNTDIITGNISNCTGGKLLKGIWNGQKQCVTPEYAVPGTGKLQNFDCSSSTHGWVRGFKTNGEVICY
tara:strand:- start:286152 stop:287435 length:1284 start_codon:yes stop_codon:yes gene_type:complete